MTTICYAYNDYAENTARYELSGEARRYGVPWREDRGPAVSAVSAVSDASDVGSAARGRARG